MPQGKFKMSNSKPVLEKKLKPVKTIKKPKIRTQDQILRDKVVDSVTKSINRKNEGKIAQKVVSNGGKLTYVRPVAPIVKKEKKKKEKKHNARSR